MLTRVGIQFKKSGDDGRSSGCSSLERTLQGAFYVQECVPELLDVKRAVFDKIDAVVSGLGDPGGRADERIVIASSSSNMASSKFASDLKNRSRVLVAHPVSFIRDEQACTHVQYNKVNENKIRPLLPPNFLLLDSPQTLYVLHIWLPWWV